MRHFAPQLAPRLRGDDEHGDVLVHQRACSNNRGTTQTGLASSNHSRHYPNDTGTEQTGVPVYPPDIPAEAGIQHHAAMCEPQCIPAFAGMTSTRDVLVHQRACSNNRGTTQTGLAPSKHSRHYPNDTGTEQTVVPAYQPVIPAKAAIHCHAAFRDPQCTPPIAGMTSTRDVLVHQRACSNNRGTTQTGLAPSKHSRHYPNDTGTEQTVVPAYPPVIPAKAGIHSWVCYFLGNRPERLRLGEFLSSFFLTREKGFSLDLNSTRTGVPCRSKTRRKVFSR